MSASKKWMGFAGLGAALAALFNKLWHRGESPDKMRQDTEPIDTPT